MSCLFDAVPEAGPPPNRQGVGAGCGGDSAASVKRRHTIAVSATMPTAASQNGAVNVVASATKPPASVPRAAPPSASSPNTLPTRPRSRSGTNRRP